MNCYSSQTILDEIDTEILKKIIGTNVNEKILQVNHQIMAPKLELKELSNLETGESSNVTGTEVDAKVDLQFATQLLYEYCHQLQPLDDFKAKPLFFLEQIAEKPILFSCSVLLPSAVPHSIRCVKGIYIILISSSIIMTLSI
jgi:hypothetical protein